jgi:hypothetical protein
VSILRTLGRTFEHGIVNNLSGLVQKQLKGCKVLHLCLLVHSVNNEEFNVVDIQLL